MRWLYPRKLYHQIVVLISVVIVAVFFTFGSLTARRQAKLVQSIVTESSMRMAQALAESCTRYLLISDYSGLDELVKKFITMSDTLQIRVCRDEGEVLSEVSKESATSPSVRSLGKMTAQVPDGATQQIVVNGDRMIIWQPVVSINVIGWVSITYSLKNIDDMRRDIWITTGKAALFWTFLSIIFFMFIFHPLVNTIQRLSDFARQLGSRKGEQIDIRHSSYEIQQLCQSLNYTSVDLYTKEQELTSYKDHLEKLVAKRTAELQKEIFERRKTEEVLKESEERLRTLINSTPDIVCFKDGEGRWLEANNAHLELFQIDGVDYRGKKDSELAGFSDFYREAFLTGEATDERTWQAQATTRGDETIPRPDGTAKMLDIIKVPLFHADKKRKGLVILGRDITERKKVERERLQLEQRLYQMQKSESLGRMAGAIAHHFNNQLSVVIGNLEMALDDLPKKSEARAYIAESMKASHRASETSRLMLTYLGQTTGRKEPLNLAETVRETIPLLDASMPQKVHLKIELPIQGPIIRADAVHIKHVITNLVTNAVEAIAENEGFVTVAMEVTAAPDVRGLRLFPLDWDPKANGYACLTVSDTGCGMDATTLEKAFDPFFSTKFTGRGLGLPVVLGLVRAHDGAIGVESQSDRVTVFRVFFPLDTEPALPPLREVTRVAMPLKDSGLVLVVDDEPEVRNIAESMLKRMLGYEVLTSGDGYEAVEIFRARKGEINLVILDLSMPGMNGWETLSALRALRHDIPVVLASGYDEAQVMQPGHADRPQAFLHKPYLRKELQAAIDAALKKPVGT